jgi:hypothetical protein
VLVAVAYTAINAYTTVNTNDAEINMDETGDVGDARFTEFYILGEKDEAHPTPVMAGKMIATLPASSTMSTRLLTTLCWP